MGSRSSASAQNATARTLSTPFSQSVIAEHRIDENDVDNTGNGLWGALKHEDSIRLFTLSRDQASRVLRFTVSEHRLSDAPQYLAISYVWGKPGNVGIIECEKGQRVLRRNLFALLNVLCDRTSRDELDLRTYFWVDALCINQDSLQEKAQQVQQIGKTFMSAAQVLVWLGTHQDGTANCLEQVFGENVTKPAWLRIASHNYWSRLWIVQEFILAKEIVFFDDRHWIGEDRFYDTHLNITRDTDFTSLTAEKSLVATLRSISSMDGIVEERLNHRSFTSKGWGWSVFDSVVQFRERQCTELRDKAYALRALSDNESSITVDYEISLGCLFWRLATGKPFESEYEDYLHVLRAFGLQICHLLPQDEGLAGVRHKNYLCNHTQRLTNHEWSHASTIAGTHIKLQCEPHQQTSIPISGQKLPAHFGHIFLTGSQHNLISYKVLGGSVSGGELLVHPRGLSFALVLDCPCNYYSQWQSARVSAIAASVGRALQLSRLSVGPLSPRHLLFCTMDICVDDSGNLVLNVARVDFLAMLVLDANIKDNNGGCCTLRDRNTARLSSEMESPTTAKTKESQQLTRRHQQLTHLVKDLKSRRTKLEWSVIPTEEEFPG